MYAVIADRVGVSRALGCKLHCHDHVLSMRYYNASYVQRRALLSALECLVVGSPVYTYSINVPQFALKQL